MNAFASDALTNIILNGQRYILLLTEKFVLLSKCIHEAHFEQRQCDWSMYAVRECDNCCFHGVTPNSLM